VAVRPDPVSRIADTARQHGWQLHIDHVVKQGNWTNYLVQVYVRRSDRIEVAFMQNPILGTWTWCGGYYYPNGQRVRTVRGPDQKLAGNVLRILEE
jgi:hypothetical protein